MAEKTPKWAYDRVLDLRIGAEFIVDSFARYIAAHEYGPVDHLLIEARKLAGDMADRCESAVAGDIKRGLRDDEERSGVQLALRALKRGMELERGK